MSVVSPVDCLKELGNHLSFSLFESRQRHDLSKTVLKKTVKKKLLIFLSRVSSKSSVLGH